MKQKDDFEASIDVLEERKITIRKNITILFIGLIISGIVLAITVLGGVSLSSIPLTFLFIVLTVYILYLMGLISILIILYFYDKRILDFIIYFKKHLECNKKVKE